MYGFTVLVQRTLVAGHGTADFVFANAAVLPSLIPFFGFEVSGIAFAEFITSSGAGKANSITRIRVIEPPLYLYVIDGWLFCWCEALAAAYFVALPVECLRVIMLVVKLLIIFHCVFPP